MKTVFEKINDFKIIDFHTHPFMSGDNICTYRKSYDMSAEDIIPTLTACGISAICGSVIRMDNLEIFSNPFERIKAENADALALKEKLGDFYIPGFHIHPDYIDESIEEIRAMSKRGIKLIGELVPYMHGYSDYSHEGLSPLLEEAEKHSMVISLHTLKPESIDVMVSAHKDVTFVAAHPGERDTLLAHIERMKKYDNVYLDISGTGIFRYHSLRYLVDQVGSERILFGSGYPICNPGFYVGGVLAEPLTDKDFENIFYNNAKRILGLND